MSDTNNPYGITREEILDLAASKLAEQMSDFAELESKATKLITERVKDIIQNGVTAKVDTFLNDEMTRIVSQEINPVNIYGEREGKPTTLKAILSQRAKDFWDVKVNADGKSDCYGGKPRSEWLFAKIVDEEFRKAIAANLESIVGAFKAALQRDAQAMVVSHIEKLIKLK